MIIIQKKLKIFSFFNKLHTNKLEALHFLMN